MILTDTGPIVALADQNDSNRDKVQDAFALLHGPMITTDACITEALYLLFRAGGWNAQDALRQMLRAGFLRVIPVEELVPLRALYYMERFQDQPCDYADATLFVFAEDSGHRRIFTIDKHFYAYRLANGEALDVVR